MTTERPIIFTAWSVQRVLAGAKTQTRRVIKPQPDGFLYKQDRANAEFTFATAEVSGPAGSTKTVITASEPITCPYGKPGDRLWCQEALSRLTLEIVSVRAERLRNISEADAEAEGVEFVSMAGLSAVEIYRSIWDGIHRKDGHTWETNPWVWVIEFKRVTP